MVTLTLVKVALTRYEAMFNILLNTSLDFNLGPNDTAAPKWGYPGNCDANTLMINNLFTHISQSHKDVSCNFFKKNAFCQSLFFIKKKERFLVVVVTPCVV